MPLCYCHALCQTVLQLAGIIYISKINLHICYIKKRLTYISYIVCMTLCSVDEGLHVRIQMKPSKFCYIRGGGNFTSVGGRPLYLYRGSAITWRDGRVDHYISVRDGPLHGRMEGRPLYFCRGCAITWTDGGVDHYISVGVGQYMEGWRIDHSTSAGVGHYMYFILL